MILGRTDPALTTTWAIAAAGAGESFRRRNTASPWSRSALFLGGKTGELIEELTDKMLEASEQLRFEAAAELRDRIKAIKSVSNKQKVIATAFSDTDAIGFARGAKSCFVVRILTTVRSPGKDFELVSEPLESDAEAISAYMRQYYSSQRHNAEKYSPA